MHEVTSSIRLELFLTKEQKRTIDGQSKICNWLFNHLLERANQLKAEFKRSGNKDAGKIVYTKRGLRNLIPELKVTKFFLKSVHSSPLKNTALRLSKSIEAYQKSRKGLRRGKAVGWPKFKSFKKQFFSLLYDETNKGYKVHSGLLHLSLGLGDEKKHHGITIAMLDGQVLRDKTLRSLRITKEASSYFAVFTVSKSLPDKKPIKRVIALDPNHKNLSYGTDNHAEALEIESPYWLKNFDKRIDELKSKRDRCKRKSRVKEVLNEKNEVIKKVFLPSHRYKRYDNALQKTLAKRREQTKTYLYTVSNALVKRYDFISIGDYTPHGGGITKKMRRAMNNRSLIGRFKEIMSWCGEKSGKQVTTFDETGSTRTCHACLIPLPEGLSPCIRSWVCPKCNVHHIRDENSSINGLRRITQEQIAPSNLGAVPSSGPVIIKKRWAWRVLPSGVHITLRGKDSSKMSNRQEIKPKEWYPSIQGDHDCISFVQD